ncbi:3-hydroxybutyryl-CoA dehydratase-like protein [Capsaspora owczarzaki ATCC 30864]|uniref:3-hydroxybutyryl-CoA dehydratase-like protein n=1 Tax=Capsaspora owczarzaki (strain ATCC 30864) TaxID=595528 RepID=A0A0D2WXA1_CAPO3|nr:3-hydroxybutyryl-CoA dehydratase-like protein [Capsaspora owczarzaki ATCC 30864]KJE97378.1 3-hydroxybutyryl-CoA dehydratase-like protein [Capsaspora owczarzaki ATCC 30864]|eukprot:XP_004343108.1 3-hydroxybutyryl-CoA dehydratase-like protein [Capsaspora owczarzaki ATCC 30864]
MLLQSGLRLGHSIVRFASTTAAAATTSASASTATRAAMITVTRDSLPADKDGKPGASTGVAIVAFNTPHNLNAFTAELGQQFEATMSKLAVDPTLRAVVLTGNGRAFSGGGDLQFLLDRSKETAMNNAFIMKAFYRRFLSIRKVPVPTIAAINGPAVGAGFCVALACDLRLAATDAKMGVNFVKIGITPGMAGTHILPAISNPQIAARLCLTGDLISGAEAKELGLVTSVEQPDQLVPRALDLARRIANNSPRATRRLVMMLRGRVDQGLEQALWTEADAQASCYSEPDLIEGINAVKEKRAPKFVDFGAPLMPGGSQE